jgi:hypothetical protein
MTEEICRDSSALYRVYQPHHTALHDLRTIELSFPLVFQWPLGQSLVLSFYKYLHHCPTNHSEPILLTRISHMIVEAPCFILCPLALPLSNHSVYFNEVCLKKPCLQPKCLLRFIGIYWNLMESIVIYCNLLEFMGIYWHLLAFIRIY